MIIRPPYILYIIIRIIIYLEQGIVMSLAISKVVSFLILKPIEHINRCSVHDML